MNRSGDRMGGGGPDVDDEDDPYYAPTGIRSRASNEDWATLVVALRSLARQTRNLQLVTRDRRLAPIAEALEGVRDLAIEVVQTLHGFTPLR